MYKSEYVTLELNNFCVCCAKNTENLVVGSRDGTTSNLHVGGL